MHPYNHPLSSSSSSSSHKPLQHEPDVDALLANAGYTVKASDLAHVAQRLEQLESVLCAAQEAGISHLSSEAVHYNPSDLAGWIECMIGELAPCGEDSSCRQGVEESLGEFGYGGSFGSCSLDERASYVGHAAAANTTTNTQQGSGSVTSMETSTSHQLKDTITHERPVVTSGYGMKEYSGITLLDELDEFEYKGVTEDQASSNHMGNFYGGLQVTENGGVFPESLDMVQQASISPHALHHSSYSQPEQLRQAPSRQQQHRQSQQDINNGARSSSNLSSHMPSFHEQIPRPQQYEQQQQLRDQDVRFANPQIQLQPVANGIHALQPVSYVDSKEVAQESGIRLVHLLMACADAVQNNELGVAREMVTELHRLASPQSGAMGKVATYFVQALARRLYNVTSQDWLGSQSDSLSELLYFHFYEACPYLKFGHFTANQAILEAFDGHMFVHVIDFDLMQGLQWPALIQALALRPGGPPRLRLTGIGPPQPDEKDVLQEIGMKLAQLADSVNVEFDFRGVVASKLDDVKPWMLQVQPGEAVAVNSILQLHRLLHVDSSGVAPIDEVLQSVRSLNPKIVTVVEQETDHNNPCFRERFMQALHYYCTMFDSLEACSFPPQSSDVTALTEMYLGREIVNIVACEGAARVERHETLAQWRVRMGKAGFKPLHLGSNAFKQASMLLTLFSGEGYTVEENNGCLTLGWHSGPLIAASAWQCG